MPRIRTIKPEFWSSPSVTAMTPWARLTFIGMWNWADDAGRGTYNPRELMGFIFPNDEDMSVAEFRALCAEIRRHCAVDFYRVAGRDYFAIPSWKMHQSKHAKLDTSKHPDPADGEPIDPVNSQVIGTAPENGRQVAENRRTSAEESPLEQGNRGTGEQGNTYAQPSKESLARVLNPDSSESIPDTSHGYPEGFERWWDTYPRKVGKRKAFEAWHKAISKRTRVGDLQEATERFADFHAQQGTDQRYIPHPTTWLNRDGWEDDLTPRRKQAPNGRIDEAEMWRQLQTPSEVVEGEVIQQRQIG